MHGRRTIPPPQFSHEGGDSLYCMPVSAAEPPDSPRHGAYSEAAYPAAEGNAMASAGGPAASSRSTERLGGTLKIDPSAVPEHAPDEALVPKPVLEATRLGNGSISDARDTTEIAARALQWCAAMQVVFEREKYWRGIRGFRFASYGFFNPRFEPDGFGFIIHTSQSASDHPRPELMIPVGDQYFRAIQRHGWQYYPASVAPDIAEASAEERAFVPVPHPFGGTTTAWALGLPVDHDGVGYVTTRTWGLLTAAHVAYSDRRGVQIGDFVPLANGQSAEVVDVGPPGIDAMLLALREEGSPPSQAPDGPDIRVEGLVAPYSDVRIAGEVSGPVQTKVLSVTDARGSLSPYIPMRVFLADACQAGDSGGLATLSDGRGVGIYTAALGNVAAGHPPEGVCQHLGQVTHCMNLKLKRG